jgi:hypothetical protein
MASFESKVSDIFNENPRLQRHIPRVIKKIFQESELQFKKKFADATPQDQQTLMLRLFDVLFIDYYFKELNGCFLDWVVRHRPDSFSESELEEMRAQAQSHIDFYEIQEVMPGKGCYVKSLYTREEGFLRDISSSSHLVKWDITKSRCYPFRDALYATGALSLFRPSDKRFILKRLDEAFSEYRERYPEADYGQFAKDNWEIFFDIEREIHDRMLNQKLYTKYGELQLCEVRFQVKNLQPILEKLDALDEFQYVETGTRRDRRKKKKVTRYRFDWQKKGIEAELESIEQNLTDNTVVFTTHQLDNAGNQIGVEAIGNLYVDKLLFRLEIQSMELAEFAVQHFEKLFGDALVFKRIVKQKLESRKKEAEEEQPSENMDLKKENPELVGKIMEDYYLNLLDQKIPSLNNMSPRQASRTPATRPLLVEWLKGLENNLARQRQAGEAVISIDRIKQILDIDW